MNVNELDWSAGYKPETSHYQWLGGVTVAHCTYNEVVVGLTPSRVAIKCLFGWVCEQVTHLSV